MKTERLNKERVMYNALAVRVTDMGSMPMETLVMPNCIVLKTEHDQQYGPLLSHHHNFRNNHTQCK